MIIGLVLVSSEITNYEWKSRTIVLSKLFLMVLPSLNSSQGNFYQMIDMKVAHPLPRLWPFKNSLERHKRKKISMAEGEKCLRRRIWGHRRGECSPGYIHWCWREGFPSGSGGKESTCNAGDPGSIPGLGRSLEERRMATHPSILAWGITWTQEPWQTTVHGVTNSQMWLND